MHELLLVRSELHVVVHRTQLGVLLELLLGNPNGTLRNVKVRSCFSPLEHWHLLAHV